jgi:hypothetical protein
MASQPRVELMIPEDSMERTVPREAPEYHKYKKKLVGKMERCAPPAPPLATLLFLSVGNPHEKTSFGKNL